MEDITKNKLPLLKENDMLLGKSEEYTLGKIKTNTDLTNALQKAIWIQEGVPENLEIKQNVFKQCAEILGFAHKNTHTHTHTHKIYDILLFFFLSIFCPLLLFFLFCF